MCGKARCFMKCWQCEESTTGKDFCNHCGAPLGDTIELTQDKGDSVAKIKISTGEIYLVIFDQGKRTVLKKVL